MFKKYSSIELLKQKSVGYVKMAGFDNEQWCVGEKVDGANFSFLIHADDPEVVRCGKRSSILGAEASFYDWQTVHSKYAHKIKTLFITLLANSDMGGKEIQSMQVYGEIYGDNIQKRLDYINHKDFIAFDIVITFTDGDIKILDILSQEYYFKLLSIPYVEYTKFPNFDEALAHVQSLDLDTEKSVVSENGSGIEGFILRPTFPRRFHNGKNVIFKVKSQKFCEKESRKKLGKPRIVKLSDNLLFILGEATKLVNENRFYSAQSKIGEFEMKRFGEFLKEMNRDVKEELEENFKEEFDALEKSEIQTLNKSISTESASVIKNFDNVVNPKI